MRILVTNDDGIHAEGLAALERIAAHLSDDVWVVAPEVEQSGASRALTLTTPLRVRRLAPKRFAVLGTPTDCVLLAIQDLIEGGPPDLVLSGVNRGQNLGEDVTVSGTVAGAMQGMALGVPGIALSQALARYHDDEQALYHTAETFAPGIIRKLLKTGWPEGVIININFPDLEPEQVTTVEVCAQGIRDVHNGHAERRTDLRGRHYYWMGWRGLPDTSPEGTDLYAVRHGRISVTPLHIDLTHRPTLHSLKGVLGGPPPKS
ncbi:MAG: stationary phase survival protein SurE [Caulobacteraceae bacterium]|jgi:5'-nucleotidase|nr:stationary phase survival protein SurE [Caulobacteraceae bacterium]